MARHYGSLGFDVTVQVRYHPAPEQNGDVAAWLDYVRRVVRAFGPNRHVTALQITNEVNISFSPNTSDGAYENAVEALVRGVPAAKREARRRGYEQLTTGFNYAWRYGDADADFWRQVGALGGKRLRRATDWIGLDAYPGTFIPPSFENAGDSLLEAVAQTRECYMPLAGFGRRVPLHIDELGYPTGPGRSRGNPGGRPCRHSSPLCTAIAEPTGSVRSSGSASATTTARGRAFNRSSVCSATTTRGSRPSLPTSA